MIQSLPDEWRSLQLSYWQLSFSWNLIITISNYIKSVSSPNYSARAAKMSGLKFNAKHNWEHVLKPVKKMDSRKIENLHLLKLAQATLIFSEITRLLRKDTFMGWNQNRCTWENERVYRYITLLYLLIWSCVLSYFSKEDPQISMNVFFIMWKFEKPKVFLDLNYVKNFNDESTKIIFLS